MFEFTKKTNSAALAFIIAGGIWFIVGTFYGLFSAMHLVSPEIFNNVPGLVFGRARPIHINTVVYGFVVNSLTGAGLYYMPALLKRTLWSEPMGWLAFFFYNLTILSGPLTFSFGLTQGREYLEYIWIFDVSLVLAVLLLIANLTMTIIYRVENFLFVSVWYFISGFLWIAGSYIIGNVMWNPPTGSLTGILDTIFLWFYGHVVVGLLLTPLAIGAAYFVIPRVTKTPVYSYTLSIIGLWTLIIFYSHIGGHHVLQAPIPSWLKTITIIDSVLMFIPILIVIINLWMTWRGKTAMLLKDVAGRWMALGIFWYLLTGFQGSLQSLPQVQRITHFNNWVVGHAHIAVLGFAAFMAIGAVWHVLPLITGRKLYSERLANIEFMLVLTGITGFFVVLTTAGLIQGESWYNGETVYRTLPQINVYMILRAMFGLFIITGAILHFVNIVMSVKKDREVEEMGDRRQKTEDGRQMTPAY